MNLNLNLLPVLETLLETQSVNRTAQLLGMTQPAVSRSLATLRQAFGDPLLVRAAGGLRLTPRGVEIARQVREPMVLLAGLLDQRGQFDPGRERAHFRIATVDYVATLIAPLLTARCAKWYPNISFDFMQAAIRTEQQFGEVDLVIAPEALLSILGKSVGHMPLWRDEIVCIAPSGRRFDRDRLDAAALARERRVGFHLHDTLPAAHVLLHPTDQLNRKLPCRVESYLSLGAVCEKTGYLALVPRILALELVKRHDVQILDLDATEKQFSVHAFWSLALDRDRRTVWLRSILSEVVRSIST